MDTAQALAALKGADFSSTAKLDSIWSDDRTFHVPDIHRSALDALVRTFQRLQQDHDTLGEVIRGPAGAGKTHLLGELRRRIGCDGYFVAFNLAGLNDFWEMAALGYLDSLQRPDPEGKRQLFSVLEGYLRSLDVPEARLRFIEAQKTPNRQVIDNYLSEGRLKLGREAREHQDVIRALFLFNAGDIETSDVGYSMLQSSEVEEAKDYGFTRNSLSASRIVRGISWIASLSKPTVLVIDQLDPVVAWSHAATAHDPSPESTAGSRRALAIIEGLTGGLMELFDATKRTVTVLSCLNETWEVLLQRGLRPAIQRFREPRIISSVHVTEQIEAIVARRLAPAYEQCGFEPPYSTWPFSREALEAARGLSPRELLRKCERRVEEFLDRGTVYELRSLSDGPTETADTGSDIAAKLDGYRAEATLDGLFDTSDEDKAFQDLLVDCLNCYVLERQLPSDQSLAVESDFEGRRPSLHARARHILHADGEREIHECFRAISHTHPRAITARLKAAITASGIDPALNLARSLTVIRGAEWSAGPVTRQLINTIEQGGGRILSLADEDLRLMQAIRRLYHERPPGFEKWLIAERPLSKLKLFQGLLHHGPASPSHDPGDSEGRSEPTSKIERKSPPASTSEAKADTGTAGHPRRIAEELTIGESERDGRPAGIRIAALPKHVAILAGSGSGKTVLIRRIIEEAVRCGIPSIVLDPNNDLARLGDRWPEPPAGWWEGDEARADDYFAKAEVNIWTPRLASGRPLSLPTMPDFSALQSEPDEVARAIDMAAATLGQLIGASGAKGQLKQGLLVECLRSFAAKGGRKLDDFIALLSDLPEGISDIQNAAKMAADMADHLRASIAKNPLLRDDVTALDPGSLLSASQAGRTAVAVINFSGLQSDEDKQVFVNKLQMALFSWLKRNPAPVDRPINGLLVMDEAQNFVPSQRSTPCSESTISLIAQARKYGLGMVLATQQPKGLHHSVISNCTTHVYGKMNSPAAISAIRELGQAKGASITDIAALERGQFYFSSEGEPVPFRIRTPLCLSHHPAHPLSEEEVAERARGSTA